MSGGRPPRRPGWGAVAAIVVGAAVLGVSIPMPAAVPWSAPPDAAHARPAPRPLTDHVLLISIDGLRPDAIEAFGATTLQEAMRAGRYSLAAETVLPSNTVPAHTTLVTGVEPSVHGVRWNDRASLLVSLATLTDRRRRAPTVFQLAAASGRTSAAVVAKSQLRQLGIPGPMDHLRAPFLPLAHWKRAWRADRVVAEVERYLLAEGGRPNLFFVHLADADLVGHDEGWMSEAYGEAVRDADRALRRILDAADAAFGAGRYAALVTSDHGGMGYGHGGADPREVRIPWILFGEGVEATGEIEGEVRIADAAATALRLLGVPVPDGWTSRSLTLTAGTGAAAASLSRLRRERRP